MATTFTFSEIVRGASSYAKKVVLALQKSDLSFVAAQADDEGKLYVSGIASPTKHTAITPNDSTDLTELANVGVIVGGAGNLAYRLVGEPSTTVTLAVVAGQFVPGQFTRVMAATTAIGVVGVSR